ncbi:MAG TPA: tyrosine-type recombinase/integrase [Beijerinckiaceae bacterium]|nr:tyrosine-type recombinase/integrase [Beijerinckiaceae bacterium]
MDEHFGPAMEAFDLEFEEIDEVLSGTWATTLWGCAFEERAVTAVTAILVREGIDYLQSKAVFKASRQRAGLQAPPDRRAAIDRLTIEEELRFIDQAYVRDGRTGLLLQALLETGARVSEFVQIRTEDVSLAERVIVIRRGKGGKRREVPIRRELAQLLQLHMGVRRAGPLFASRQRGSGTAPYVYTRQRVGQIVREVACAAGVTKRVYPHLLRHTVATKLLALGMDITDVQRFLGHESLTTTRLYAETTAAVLRRKFDQITAPPRPPMPWSRPSSIGMGTRWPCLRPTCSWSIASSGSALLMHDLPMLAATQAGVDRSPGERNARPALAHLCARQSLLERPARIGVVEDLGPLIKDPRRKRRGISEESQLAVFV